MDGAMGDCSTNQTSQWHHVMLDGLVQWSSMDKAVPRTQVWPYEMRGDSDSVPHSQGLKVHARHGQGCVWGSV